MRFQLLDLRFQMGAAVLVACLGGAGRAEVIDRVLAVVAGELILQSDVAAARQLQLVNIDPGAADPARQVLSQLIDRALILAEVERFAPPEPDAAEVDAALARLRSRFPSPEVYAATLTRVGLEERHLRETLRQDLRMTAYLAQRFTSQPPTDDEIGRYYREHAAAYTRDGVVQPFEAVRTEVAAALANERRAGMVGDWLAGLRRRADIRDLSAPPSGR